MVKLIEQTKHFRHLEIIKVIKIIEIEITAQLILIFIIRR